MIKYYWILLFIITVGCTSPRPFLSTLEHTDNALLKRVFEKPEMYELQIIYSEIVRKPNGIVEFKDHTYHLNDSMYFYPASTVKLPVAILALEKLNELKENKGLQISKETPYSVAGDSIFYTIKNDVEAIFAVSDNDAFNRLYEFLGSDEINSKLRTKGLSPLRISHRLSTEDAFSSETKAISFYEYTDDTNALITLPNTQNSEVEELELKEMKKGIGYFQNDTLINAPFDFSLKNYFPLSVQHNVMKQLFFPDNYNVTSRFNLAKEDRKFLIKAMSQVPREAGYNVEEYYDSYGKFFMFGDSKQPIPKHVNIYNKVGYAYGTLTETAYIQDKSHHVEFILSATILVNKNQIFNDNVYEYDAIGIPFFAELGRTIYAHILEQNSK